MPSVSAGWPEAAPATPMRLPTPAAATLPDFRSAEFLRHHALSILAFYDGRALDPSGGFFHCFKDDGSVYDRRSRHLVSSTRFVVTHAMAARCFADHPRADAWRAAAEHGLRFVQQVHRNPVSGGYAWLLDWDGQRATARDATNHCYGLAFVLLAHAQALRAGVPVARAGLFDTVALLERHFWEPAQGLYADEAGADPQQPWQLSAYRGQNANMHACEAFLAAYDATGDAALLDRAATLAEAVTGRLAAQAGGLIWEHYRSADGAWQVDPDYHRDDPAHLFRPWGFQTGHLTEWAKLLLTLDRRRPDGSGLRRQRAQALTEAAFRHGWDAQHGGLVYGFAGAHDALGSDGQFRVCDGHHYFWVQAESLAALARLALAAQAQGERAEEAAHWRRYDALWRHAWTHFVDHRHGAWFRLLGPDLAKLSDEKSPPGKTDYHTLGACCDMLEALAEAGR